MAADVHTSNMAEIASSSAIDASVSAAQDDRSDIEATPTTSSLPSNSSIPSTTVGMSATFKPKDLHEFYQYSSENKELHNHSGSGSETPTEATKISTNDIDWRCYAAPAGMAENSTIASDILLSIITDSIQNIVTRNQGELAQEEETAAREHAAQEQAASEASHNKVPYLPVVIPQPSEITSPATQNNSVETSKNSFDAILPTPPSPTKDASKKKKFGIKKLFRRSHDGPNSGGESSAAGARREAMREYFEHRLSKINLDSQHQGAQETIAALRKSKSIKVPKAQKLVECVSCLEDIPVKETVKVACHSYCKDCFSRLITAACQNEQQWPPKCCLNEISFRIILKNIPDELKVTFQKRQSEWNIPIGERVYCHTPDCGEWVRPAAINLASRVGTCSGGHATCTICRGAAHANTDCPQDQDLSLTNKLAEDEGWKRCGRCQALVEHREACQHMTCRCGYQFCYVCTRRWRTCSCTMQQLTELKQSVTSRRMQRHNQEQAEADELRQILAQIEQFEVEQARRAEEERQEQLRLQEERWQQIVKKRIRLETLRRRLIEEKYHEFRQQMESLHAVQQVLVVSQQDADSKELASQHHTAILKLEEEHTSTKEDLKIAIENKITNKEAMMQADYAARVKLEREVEQSYKIQLREYWEGKPNAEEEIVLAMHTLQKRLDQGHLLWQSWKDSEVEMYRNKLEDESSEREEVMYSVRQRLKAQHHTAETELARRLVAEKQWVVEIIQERDRLLSEAETDETNGDADSLFSPDNEDMIAETMESINSEMPNGSSEVELIEQLMENVWTEEDQTSTPLRVASTATL